MTLQVKRSTGEAFLLHHLHLLGVTCHAAVQNSQEENGGNTKVVPPQIHNFFLVKDKIYTLVGSVSHLLRMRMKNKNASFRGSLSA